MAELSSQDYLNQGKKAFEGRDFQEAHRLFSLAIFQMEENKGELGLPETKVAEAYVLRASALWRDDEAATFQDTDVFHQVLNDFEQALDMQPRNAALLNLRGRLYMGCEFEDHRARAREDFQAALEILPDDLETLRNLAEVLARMESHEEAADYLTKAIDLGNHDPELYLRRGVAFFKKRPPEFKAAAADFGQAENLAPEVDETYIWRAQCFQEMGEVRLAVEEYDKLISFSPKAEYLVDRGVIKLELSEDEALADFDEALELEPHPLAYNNRAGLLRMRGELEEAEQDAKEALRIAPEYTVAQATLAEIYADMGDRSQMLHHLDIALDTYYDDVVDVMSEPAFAPYLNDPGFLALIQKSRN